MDFDAYMRAQWARLRALDEMAIMPEPAHAKPIQQKETPPAEIEGIEAMNKRRVAAFSQMNRLHGQLRFFPSDSDRLSASKRILELERELQECWRIIDHHSETGELLAFSTEQEAEPFDPSGYRDAELLRMRSNAQKYISNAPKRGYAPEKVQERRELIQTINDYLA